MNWNAGERAVGLVGGLEKMTVSRSLCESVSRFYVDQRSVSSLHDKVVVLVGVRRDQCLGVAAQVAPAQ